MADEKKVLNNEEVENINGGTGTTSGWYMTVSVQSGYLALRPQPCWNQYHELAQIPSGALVYTENGITNGTSLNGTPCQYRWVCYNDQWGWANAAFLI